jgi:hypothetical protein
MNEAYFEVGYLANGLIVAVQKVAARLLIE